MYRGLYNHHLPFTFSISVSFKLLSKVFLGVRNFLNFVKIYFVNNNLYINFTNCTSLAWKGITLMYIEIIMKVDMEHNRTLIQPGSLMHQGLKIAEIGKRKFCLCGASFQNYFWFGGRGTAHPDLTHCYRPASRNSTRCRFRNSTRAFKYKRHHILLNRVLSAHARHDAIKSRVWGQGFLIPVL